MNLINSNDCEDRSFSSALTKETHNRALPPLWQ